LYKNKRPPKLGAVYLNVSSLSFIIFSSEASEEPEKEEVEVLPSHQLLPHQKSN
jgi:hypothetical protein